jgi:hypothetical protein
MFIFTSLLPILDLGLLFVLAVEIFVFYATNPYRIVMNQTLKLLISTRRNFHVGNFFIWGHPKCILVEAFICQYWGHLLAAQSVIKPGHDMNRHSKHDTALMTKKQPTKCTWHIYSLIGYWPKTSVNNHHWRREEDIIVERTTEDHVL